MISVNKKNGKISSCIFHCEMRYSHPPLLILLLLLTACQHSPSICSDERHYAGWLFDGQGWTEERPIPYGARPGEPTFLTPEVVYDVKRETLVLLTGFGGQDVGSWAFDYDGVEWKTVVDNTSVSGINNLLGFFDLTYDFKRNVIVLFGAFDVDEQIEAQTWEYDGTEWKEIATLDLPSLRIGHTMAYDQFRDVVVLYGGTDPITENHPGYYDTWEYDGSIWTQK